VKRNGKIELMRFLFSMAVMIFHSYYFAADGAWSLFKRGALGVEFFFIVSGYLMARSAAKRAKEPCADLGKETTAFIGHKISSLMPNFIVAWVLGLFVMFFRAGDYTFGAFLNRAIEGVWELLFLVMAGFGKVRVNVDWYISAMLLAMLFLYPLMRKNFSVFSRIVAPIVAAFVLGFFYFTSLTPTNVMQYYTVIYKGMLRAVAELCLGVALYPCIEKLKGVSLTKHGRRLVTAAELSCWLIVFGYMAFHQTKTYDFFIMIFITGGIVLAFSHQGAFAGWFDKPVFAWLGEFSLSLYLGHSYWSHFIEKYFSHIDYWTLLIPYICVSLLSGLLVYYVSKGIKKVSPKVLAYLKQKLVAQ